MTVVGAQKCHYNNAQFHEERILELGTRKVCLSLPVAGYYGSKHDKNSVLKHCATNLEPEEEVALYQTV